VRGARSLQSRLKDGLTARESSTEKIVIDLGKERVLFAFLGGGKGKKACGIKGRSEKRGP